jgi:hypothetical protein
VKAQSLELAREGISRQAIAKHIGVATATVGNMRQSVIEQMKAFATINSVREGKRVWYGIIDGDDTRRLLAAYPRQFGVK